MNKLLLTLLIPVLTGLTNTCVAKKLTAMLSYATFYTPSKGPFVETYLSVSGRSVVFTKGANGKYQGTIVVGLIFKKDDQVKYSDKYNLLSQEISDTNEVNFNFVDQQRINLPNGNYTFILSIADKYSTEPAFTNEQKIEINFPEDKIFISGIQLLESFTKTEKTGPITKNGFDLVPYVNNFYPPAIKSLKFYAEIYNTKKVLTDNGYLLSYYLEDYESKITLDKYKVFSKQQPKEVNAVMSELNIESLPSGNYNLVVEVRNNKNDLMAIRETFFQRSNTVFAEAKEEMLSADISNTFVAKLTDSLRLKETIRSFRPIANVTENNFEDFQLKRASLITMQRYVYHFWKTREPNNPETAFIKYMELVETVNAAFKTPIDKGYETDRGRVYLQYGAPNEAVKEDREPDTYPYEIWHYYKIKNESNKKFVFYNRDLVSNDYRLLHSDMSGENFETSWQDILHHRNSKVNDDGKSRGRNFGDRSDDNFGKNSSSDFPH